jgi:hypothetical protein
MGIYGNAHSGDYEDDGDERMHPDDGYSFDGNEHDGAVECYEEEQEEYDDSANEALQLCSMLRNRRSDSE